MESIKINKNEIEKCYKDNIKNKNSKNTIITNLEA